MNKLELSLSCWDFDRTKPLLDGRVQPEGIDLVYLRNPAEETFWRMIRHKEFDVSEMSMSSYLIHKSRGGNDYTAIPIFPSRVFRHSSIYINANAGIEKPEDLKGKKVGVPEYQITAALWIRGILQDEYGVRPEDMQWFQGGEEEPGRIEKLPIDLPEGVELQNIGSTKTLNSMLESGEIDALVSARAPSSFENGSGNVVRLFSHYKDVEKEYYKKTGIFPIMHTIVIKQSILDKHPWVAQNLYEAFMEAKEKSYEDIQHTVALKTMLPWLSHHVEETKSVMGDDIWPYGIEKNQTTLEKLLEYSYDQGLIKERLSLSDLFVSSTLDKYLI